MTEYHIFTPALTVYATVIDYDNDIFNIVFPKYKNTVIHLDKKCIPQLILALQYIQKNKELKS